MTLKLISIQIPTAWQVWVKSIVSVAVGGAIGALTDMSIAAYNSTTGKIEINKIDFHQVGMLAVSGAFTALVHLWQHKPTSPDATATPVKLVSTGWSTGPEIKPTDKITIGPEVK